MSAKNFDCKTAEFLAMITKEMPEMTSAQMGVWIENRFHLRRVLASALLPIDNFEVWREIEIGGVPIPKLLRDLKFQGCEVEEHAETIILSEFFPPPSKPRKVKLARYKIYQLGFLRSPHYPELWNKVESIGGLCPAEVALHLLKSLDVQPARKSLEMVMKPLLYPPYRNANCVESFRLNCVEEGKYLQAVTTRPNTSDTCDFDRDIIFVLP